MRAHVLVVLLATLLHPSAALPSNTIPTVSTSTLPSSSLNITGSGGLKPMKPPRPRPRPRARPSPRPSPMPPPAPRPYFEALLDNRIYRLNDTILKRHAPILLTQIQASAYPGPASSNPVAFTTLRLKLYSPSSNLHFHTFNNLAEPTHWTKPMENEAEWEENEGFWDWREKTMGIDMTIRTMAEQGQPGPFRWLVLGKFKEDPWGVDQLYWRWTTGNWDSVCVGDQDHGMRSLSCPQWQNLEEEFEENGEWKDGVWEEDKNNVVEIT